MVASGVAAINCAMLAFLKAGDHVLVSDGVYGPTRSFCDHFLRRFAVETTYFPPTATPEELEALMKPNTKALFLESPSSLTFELHDFAALASVAAARGAAVVADNTWGPLRFRPLEHGAPPSPSPPSLLLPLPVSLLYTHSLPSRRERERQRRDKVHRGALRRHGRADRVRPPPPLVLSGHAASLTPY